MQETRSYLQIILERCSLKRLLTILIFITLNYGRKKTKTDSFPLISFCSRMFPTKFIPPASYFSLESTFWTITL